LLLDGPIIIDSRFRSPAVAAGDAPGAAGAGAAAAAEGAAEPGRRVLVNTHSTDIGA